MSIFWLGAAVAIAGLLAPESVRGVAQHHGPLDAPCAVPSGWSAVVARRTPYVVFGEVHGTREGPAFIGSLVCGLATTGERLLVAVEHDSSNNAALQMAWLLPEEAFAVALRNIGWDGRKDGVGSKAMFELIQGLHRLKAQGRAIDLVAFNGFQDVEQRQRFSHLPAQGPHEAGQAENIRRASERRKYDQVIVLVGNLHARKTPVEQGGVRYRPMAMQLAPPEEVTTLNMKYAKGSMWNCLLKPNVRRERGRPLGPDAIDCGIHGTSGSPVDLGTPPFIRLGKFPSETSDPSYDGFYWVGPVSGSPPAISKI